MMDGVAMILRITVFCLRNTKQVWEELKNSGYSINLGK